MLNQENRLRKVRDFNLLMQHGFVVRGRLFGVRVLKLAKIKDYIPKKEDPSKFISQLKLAFVVGAKMEKSAVKRNRLKRQMREVVRLLLKEGALKPGYYILLMANKAALGKDYAEISEEIKLALLRSGSLKSSKSG